MTFIFRLGKLFYPRFYCKLDKAKWNELGTNFINSIE